MTHGGNVLRTSFVSYQTCPKCSIFRVWLIACYTNCLGPSLDDISKVACIFLPCATCGTGGTYFNGTVSKQLIMGKFSARKSNSYM